MTEAKSSHRRSGGVVWQKHTDEYSDVHGGKWPLERLALYLSATVGESRCAALFRDIRELVRHSLLAVQPRMAPETHAFELYGYDVLVDSRLRPWLIEVNASPSLTVTTDDDRAVKLRVVSDTLDIAVRDLALLPFEGHTAEDLDAGRVSWCAHLAPLGEAHPSALGHPLGGFEVLVDEQRGWGAGFGCAPSARAVLIDRAMVTTAVSPPTPAASEVVTGLGRSDVVRTVRSSAASSVMRSAPPASTRGRGGGGIGRGGGGIGRGRVAGRRPPVREARASRGSDHDFETEYGHDDDNDDEEEDDDRRDDVDTDREEDDNHVGGAWVTPSPRSESRPATTNQRPHASHASRSDARPARPSTALPRTVGSVAQTTPSLRHPSAVDSISAGAASRRGAAPTPLSSQRPKSASRFPGVKGAWLAAPALLPSSSSSTTAAPPSSSSTAAAVARRSLAAAPAALSIPTGGGWMDLGASPIVSVPQWSSGRGYR